MSGYSRIEQEWADREEMLKRFVEKMKKEEEKLKNL